MIKRKIKTRLVGKDELFRVIALGESTQKPILLVGVPGVAKTQSLIDYAAAMYNYDKDATRENCFILELDEGTKSSEIKGRVNMESLLVDKKYKIDAPVADAGYVLINEVDKGSSAVRNTMLSVMRERALFLGSEIRQCNWKLFAGSCNIINKDEEDAPFWDRFLIKYTVDRVKLMDIASKVWLNKRFEIEINIPERSDLDSETLNGNMMKIFLKCVYKHVSDRTAVAIPELVKGIKLIWNYSDAEAIMKCCEFVCPEMHNDLSGKLEDPAIASIKTKIKNISAIDDQDLLIQNLNAIENDISQLEINPLYEKESKQLTLMLKDTMSKAANCQQLVEDLTNKVGSNA